MERMQKTNLSLEVRIKTEIFLLGGIAGVYFEDLADNEIVQINESVSFPAASVIKIPIMVHAMKLAKNNKLNFYDTIDFKLSLPEYTQDEGSGILTHLTSEISLTIRDLLILMIIESDNLASNRLIEYMGIDNINATILDLGLENTKVNHLIDDFDALANPACNPTTLKDISVLLREMAYRHLPLSDFMIDILKEQKYIHRIPFFIGDDEDVEIANKTGTLDGIVHDVGIISSQNYTYILSVMTMNQENNLNASLGIARISEILFKYIEEKHKRISS